MNKHKYLIALGLLLAAVIVVGGTVASAQDVEPPTSKYVGSQTCAGCHAAEHTNWAASLHPRMIQDPKIITNAILANFASFTQVITDPKLKYDAKDIVFTMGWRYRQRYILRDSKTRRLVIGAGQWNIAGQGPAKTDNTWQPAAAGDDWLNACAGCHTTGLNVEAARIYKVGDKTLPYVELGIGCEACHGPGGEHAQAPTKDNIPINKIEALDATLCGQCHTNGSSPQASGQAHGYPIGYVHGEPLTGKNFVPVKPTGVITDANWWIDGHAKNYRLQYLEWSSSAHAKALENLRRANATDDTCLGCHSADYIAITAQPGGQDMVTPTLKTAQFGVTCQVCHAPHQKGTRPFNSLLREESYKVCVSCHNATHGGKLALTPGEQVHYAAQEMFEGRGALDVEGKPSVHLPRGGQSGATCAACHMPGTATSADAGDIATHNWQIVMPGKAQDKEPNACSACHSDPQSKTIQMDAASLQKVIDARQTEIKNKIQALTQLLKNVKSAHANWDIRAEQKTEQQIAYEKALTNISFVETEASYGIHNYEYAQAVLAKAEEQLKVAAATPTPAPTVEPTQTPEPSPTPLVLPPTPTPIPAPAGGASWSTWLVLAAVVVIVVVLLMIRSKPG